MVIATGFFDGVHIGHRKVLGQLVEESRARGEESVAITFWPHPRTVLQKDAGKLRLLNTLQEKKELILGLGVDRVEVLDFTKEFSRLTCEDYLRDLVRDRFKGTAVLLGYDNRLGSDLATPAQAALTARKLGLDAIVCDAVEDADAAVSSTRIRAALDEGRVEDAASMLGYGYMLGGTVVPGRHLGHSLGFPTANLQPDEPLKQVPRNGVYFVKIYLCDGIYRGMCNIGVRPTVGDVGVPSIETNIFDFDGDVYGRRLRLQFISRIRDERRFDSLDELRDQLATDRNFAKSLSD